MIRTATFLLALICTVCMNLPARCEEPKDAKERTAVALPKLGQSLSDAQVDAFAQLALKNIHREYPNKTKALHPAFYGCFDWHSSVHGHWMLVKLLKDYPQHSVCKLIRENLAINLTKENLDAELAYFSADEHKSFERTYGWAWYLKLVAELDDWDDDQGRQWRRDLKPLEELLVKRTLAYLPNGLR